MDWINGLQKAVDYIEANLEGPIDMEIVAAQSFSSSYHFQRVFGILCGFTVGEYIRNRRLSLAGTELAAGDRNVIDVALKYGYESPDSFSKAFRKFHGVLPSQVKSGRASIRSFSRLVLKISLEGGNVMNYRIEKKPEMTFTGYKKRFSGTPADRREQENEFYVTTRINQYLLKGLSRDCDTQYNIMCNFEEGAYDFYIASLLDEWHTDNLQKALGYDERAKCFERITVPESLYLVCETEREKYPTMLVEELRKKAVSEWLISSDYELSDSPEISVAHWYYKYGDAELSNSRYIELWLPIKTVDRNSLK